MNKIRILQLKQIYTLLDMIIMRCTLLISNILRLNSRLLNLWLGYINGTYNSLQIIID